MRHGRLVARISARRQCQYAMFLIDCLPVIYIRLTIIEINFSPLSTKGSTYGDMRGASG